MKQNDEYQEGERAQQNTSKKISLRSLCPPIASVLSDYFINNKLMSPGRAEDIYASVLDFE